MKKNLLLAVAFVTCMLIKVHAQDVFNPTANDAVVNYNGTLPSYGAPFTFKKWIRTPNNNLPNPFSTEKFKAYFYRASGNAYDTGMAFRLRYPNNYNPNNATKYPVILFMHGIGEAGALKDNETNLSWGAKEFEAKIDAGQFNAFLLFPQTVYGDWKFNFTNINATLDALQQYCNADPDRIITMGISLGGDGTMKYTFAYPQRSAISIPASPGSIGDFTQDPTNPTNPSEFGNTPFIHVPFWIASGGQDDQFSNPTRVSAFVNNFTGKGGDVRWTFYPDRGHGTWPYMWDEPYLVPYWQSAHKANPLVFGKQTNFPANTPFSVKIGITPGFAQYQWQRDGADLPNTTNEITVTTPGTYRVRFRRVANGAWSDFSPNPAVITQPAGTDNVAPSVPGNLHSTAVTTNSVSLDWDNSTDNVGVTGYDVYVNGTKVATPTSSDYVVGSLNASTQYTFTVQAHDAAGNFSAQTAGIQVTTSTAPDVTPPSVPGNLHSTAITTNSVSLDWDNSTDNIAVTGYDVYVNGTKVATPTSSDYVVGGLNASTLYTFTVQAHDAAGNFSAQTAGIQVTTSTPPDVTPPSVPGNLHSTAITTNSVSLDWDNSTDNIAVTGYDVYVNGTKVATPTSSDYVVGSLNPSTQYTFTVQAHDAAGNFSAQTAGIQVTTSTPPDVTAPTIPGNLHVTGTTTNSISLDWDNSTDNVGVAGYDVFVNGTLRFSPTSSDIVATSLNASSTYTFTVRARDAAGNLSGFAQVMGTTATAPDVTAPSIPANVHVVSVTANSVTLDWDNSTDNVGVAGYDIYLNGTKSYSNTTSDVVATGLNPSTTYTFTVVARDLSNNLSGTSTPVNGTTSAAVDNTAPTVPANLHITATTTNTISLDWDNSTDNVGVTGYDVYVNGSKVATPTSSDYVVTNLTASTSYNFTVQAHDAAGNFSAQSGIVNGSTSAAVDNVAPSVPANLHVTATTTNSISLDWDNSTDNVGVTGYDVYVNGSKVATPASSDYMVINLSASTSYNFTVQAHDAAGNFSAQSGVVNASTAAVSSGSGLSYKYYQGSFTVLPNFTTLTPVSTGSTANVDISIRPAGVNDNFAFLWEGYIVLPTAGTYTFETVSDDGSKLYFNTTYSAGANALVNNDGLHAAISATGSVTVSAGTYPIAITYYEATGGESMQVYWTGPGIARQLIPNSAFTSTGTPPSTTNGINFKYYEGAFTTLPNFSALTPVKTGTSATPDITVRNSGVNDNFAFLWEGFITLPTAGTYTFETVSDDGSKLYFNTAYSAGANALVNNDGLHAAGSVTGNVTIAAGTYPIAISFFEATGGESMQVYWTGPGIARQLIPASAFTTGGTTTPPSTTNGLNYKYYQGTYTTLPNFSALTPIKTGTSANTDINERTAGVNDNFAFLWEGYVTLPTAGQYTFETVSDDGSKLFFNTTYSAGATALVNNDGLHAPTSATGVTGNMAAGTYPIAIGFFEATGGESMQVYWTGPGIARQLIPNSAFTTSSTTTPPASTSGLNYKYYEGTFTALPNFNTLSPVKTGTTPTADITVRNTGVNDNFAFLWSGYIHLPTAGTYTFETVSDDGSKLYFNTTYAPGATALVNNDGLHAPTSATGSVTVAAGAYPIAIAYFEATGGESIQVYWTGPGITRQLIPASAFTLTSAFDGEEASMSQPQPGVQLNGEATDDKLSIKQIYPNPFSENFTINFYNASSASKISIDMVDVSGRSVYKQNFGNLSVGSTTLKINPGKQASVPGVYFVRMMVNGVPMKVVKMMKK